MSVRLPGDPVHTFYKDKTVTGFGSPVVGVIKRGDTWYWRSSASRREYATYAEDAIGAALVGLGCKREDVQRSDYKEVPWSQHLPQARGVCCGKKAAVIYYP